MIILAIETSCDDTGVAVVEKEKGRVKVLGSALSSQTEIHKKWGGVYPTEAKREHQKNLIPVMKKALKKASLLEKGITSNSKEIGKILSRESFLLKETENFLKKNKIKKIDAVAVTTGPGLEPCLWVGVNFAKALSLCLDVPLIPINHIKAHLFFFLFEKEKIKFPAVALVASGGHTELVLANSFSSFELIGKTRDDAAGECFDKAARILGLGYPGGPAIARQAELWKSEIQNPKFEINLPRPMMYSKNYDFSFSGLKTAVLYDFLSRNERTKKSKKYKAEMAKEIEEAITDVLVFKLKKAVKEYRAKTIILGGGVTANKTLQKKVKKMEKEFPGIEVLLPSIRLATDNAEIVGAAAALEKPAKDSQKIEANANIKIYDKMR